MVCPSHLTQELRGIGDAEIIGTMSPQADKPQGRILHHDRMRGPPLAPRKKPGGHKIDVRFEGTLKPITPRRQPGQKRDRVGLKHMLAGAEKIAIRPKVNKLGDLSLRHNESGPALNGPIPIVVTESQRIPAHIHTTDQPKKTEGKGRGGIAHTHGIPPRVHPNKHKEVEGEDAKTEKKAMTACPNCGGKNPEGPRTKTGEAKKPLCRYCGQSLGSVICHHAGCLQFNPVDSKFCQSCGRKIATAKKSASPLHCPACSKGEGGVSLEFVTFEEKGGSPEISLHICPQCEGAWADETTADRLLQKAAGKRTGAKEPEAEDKPYLFCPVCKEMMARKTPGQGKLPTLDICREHGIWFERGEIQEIATPLDRVTELENRNNQSPDEPAKAYTPPDDIGVSEPPLHESSTEHLTSIDIGYSGDGGDSNDGGGGGDGGD
jgi:Zn-finger nucleic acid-binding protein